MSGFIDELTLIRTRLHEMQRTTPQPMLWEDPVQACQPFWDAVIFDRRTLVAGSATSDDGPRPLVVFSHKPFVERRASRSRAR